MDSFEGDHILNYQNVVPPPTKVKVLARARLPVLRLFKGGLDWCRLSHPPIRTSINMMAKALPLLLVLMLCGCLLPADGEILTQNTHTQSCS